jgi:hypothetical protein
MRMKALFKVLTLLVKHHRADGCFASIVGGHLIAWIFHWALQEKEINK